MTHPTTTTTAPAYAPRNGYGITALVLAITGLVFGLVPFTGFLALILGALAVVFGLLGRGRAGRGEATNPRMSVTAAGLGVLAAVLGIWGMTILFGAVDKFSTDMQHLGQGSTSISTEAPTYDAVTAPADLPMPSEFKLAVKTLSKQCFGSAGCNITYQIEPTYSGSTPLPTDKTLTVVYQVLGGQDGPQINNFTVTGQSVRYDKTEFVGTASSSAVLSATAMSVSTN